MEECLPAVSGADAAWEERQITECLQVWLRKQTLQDRVIFLRRYFMGENVKELARESGIPANTMAQRLKRLRTSLRAALEAEGVNL